jgi:hypothetical protein
MNMTQIGVTAYHPWCETKGHNTGEGRLRRSLGEGSPSDYLIEIHQHEMQILTIKSRRRT